MTTTPAAPSVLVARTIDDVPPQLPEGLVVVLPGGFRMRSAHRSAPHPLPAPAAVAEPPQLVPPDARDTRDRAVALTRLVVEVLAGRRAPAQLGGLVSPRALRYLGAVRLPGTAPRWSGRVHVSQPQPDAAEICTTLPVAGRPRALAVRLDRHSTGTPWTVTAVRLI